MIINQLFSCISLQNIHKLMKIKGKILKKYELTIAHSYISQQ